MGCRPSYAIGNSKQDVPQTNERRRILVDSPYDKWEIRQQHNDVDAGAGQLGGRLLRDWATLCPFQLTDD